MRRRLDASKWWAQPVVGTPDYYIGLLAEHRAYYDLTGLEVPDERSADYRWRARKARRLRYKRQGKWGDRSSLYWRGPEPPPEAAAMDES